MKLEKHIDQNEKIFRLIRRQTRKRTEFNFNMIKHFNKHNKNEESDKSDNLYESSGSSSDKNLDETESLRSDDSYYDENEKLDVLCINEEEQVDRDSTF